jgi:hypothetical protein
MTRGDGQMPVLTYDRGEQKIGWSRQILGGYQDAAKAQAGRGRSVCSIPDPNDARDEVWLIVQRVINGKTERYVEVLRRSGRSRRRPGAGVLCRFRPDLRRRGFPDPAARRRRRCQRRRTGVTFTAGAAVFPPAMWAARSRCVGSTIRRDPEDPSAGRVETAKARITGYTRPHRDGDHPRAVARSRSSPRGLADLLDWCFPISGTSKARPSRSTPKGDASRCDGGQRPGAA